VRQGAKGVDRADGGALRAGGGEERTRHGLDGDGTLHSVGSVREALLERFAAGAEASQA
jgi:hypothetical protein